MALFASCALTECGSMQVHDKGASQTFACNGITQNCTECGHTQTHTLPTLGTAILAGTYAQAASMHLCCKSLQSMFPGEAFCQVGCLMVTLLLNVEQPRHATKNVVQFFHQSALHAEDVSAVRGIMSTQRTFKKPFGDMDLRSA